MNGELKACKHERVAAWYDYASCLDCGAFRTDSGGGIASCRWLESRDMVEFYKKNGRLPEPARPTPAPGAPFTERHALDLRGITVGEVITEDQWESVCAFVREQDALIDSLQEKLADSAPGALPKLPEPAARMKRPSAQNSFNRDEPYFTASQMHAYAITYAEQCHVGADGSKEVCAFESWALAQGFHSDDFDRIEGRPANKLGLTWEYNGNFLQASWAAWMERAALQSAFADDEGVKRG